MKWLALCVIRLFAWLPLTTSRRFGVGLGWLMSRFDTGAARVTRVNLALCFPRMPEEEREKLTRRSLGQSACLLVESGPLTHWPDERLRRMVVGEVGRQSLDASLEAGGVLMLVPHFGNWEFLCFALGDTGLLSLYNPPGIGPLDEVLRRSRERFGARMRPAGVGGVRAAFRQLDAGGLVCLLPDQVPGAHGGVHAPFFGHPALTATLAFRLIKRSRPTVMLGSARRTPGGFHLSYEPLGAAFDTSDPYRFAELMNRAIESLVVRDPAQYQWEYKRFKKQPPGLPPVYRGRSAP